MTERNTSHISRLIIGITIVFANFFFGPLVVHAATLSVSPQTGVHTVGSVFTVNVRVNTSGSSINAAEGTLNFDHQKLSVVSLSKGSIFNLWTVEPSFSNSAGTITFGGGSPSGYTGSAGTILTITFRAKTAGDARVAFGSGSVLAADGRGTNVLSNMGSAAFTIASAEVPAEPETIEYLAEPNTPSAPIISSTSHPDPQGWYQNTTAKLVWDIPTGVTSVRTLLDGNSGSIPTKVYETPIDSISIEDLEEGVSYFHLQFKNAEGWGRVRHYRLGVDVTTPSKFNISLPENADLTAPAQTLQLEVEDEPSGIAYYTVQIDNGEPYEYIDETGSSTITLPELEPGHHSVIMEAFDSAGNSLVSTFSFNILAFDKPEFTEYPSEINSEVIPVIKGATRPESVVTVTVRKIGSGEESRTYELQSDTSGTFTLIPDGTFENGVYELSAIATDPYGAKSDPSDPIRIAVQDPGFLIIGSFIVSFLSVLVPLAGLVLLLILLAVYFLRRLRVIGATVTRETKEALDVLDTEFKRIHEVLTAQQNEMASSRKSKKLTKAEQELIDAVTEQLTESRKRLAKEVNEVDDIVE